MMHQLLDQDRDRCQRETRDSLYARSRYVSYIIEFELDDANTSEPDLSVYNVCSRWLKDDRDF